MPTDTTTPVNYDLVIHGPDIATVIIKSVPVSVGDPASGTVASVGTIPVRAASSFTTNLKSEEQAFSFRCADRLLPDAAAVGRSAVLSSTQGQIDPFSRTFYEDHALSLGTIDYGTYDAAGITLANSTPVQGAGVYTLSATAAGFADGGLSQTIAAPSSGSGTALATLAALNPVSGSDASSLSLRVTAGVPGRYDRAQLIVSRDGAIIQTAHAR
ncbi:MAG: hypothetical protein WDO12_06680 [Pseudomonadota bacterium]